MDRPRLTTKTYLALVVTLLLWASSFVAIRIGLRGYSPGALGLLRYITASICLAGIFFRRPHRIAIKWSDLPFLIISGVLGIGVYNVGLNHGELTTTAATASFIASQNPVFVIILAIIFLGERLRPIGIFGFAISIIGILIIAFGQHQQMHFNPGIWYILIGTLGGSCYTVFQKPLLQRISATDATTLALWIGTLSLLYFLPDLLHELPHAPLKSTLAAIYLGIFPAAIAYICWAYVLARLSACRTVIYQYFLPLITTMMGWLILSEMPSLIVLIGGLVALFGTIFVTQNTQSKLVENKINKP